MNSALNFHRDQREDKRRKARFVVCLREEHTREPDSSCTRLLTQETLHRRERSRRCTMKYATDGSSPAGIHRVHRAFKDCRPGRSKSDGEQDQGALARIRPLVGAEFGKRDLRPFPKEDKELEKKNYFVLLTTRSCWSGNSFRGQVRLGVLPGGPFLSFTGTDVSDSSGLPPNKVLTSWTTEEAV